MENIILYVKFIVDLLKYFNSINLTFIYNNSIDHRPSSHISQPQTFAFREFENNRTGFDFRTEINDIDVKNLYYELQKNSTFYTKFLNINRINFTKEINTEESTIQPLIVIYLSSVDLISLKSQMAKALVQLDSAKWLIFVNNDDVEKVFNIIKPNFISQVFIVPFVKNNSFVVNEIFSKSKQSRLYIKPFGYWNITEGIQPIHSNPSLPFRRKSLKNTVLRVTTIENYPFVMLDDGKKPKKISGGFFGRIWNILEEQIQFTSQVMIPADNGWGTINPNGKWNGMMGQIIEDEADFAVADFSMTLVRMNFVKFATVIMTTQQELVIRSTIASEISWTGFLKSFNKSVWFSILLLILILSQFSRLINYRNPNKEPTECYLETLQTFCQQGGIPQFPKSSVGFLFYTFLYYIGILIVVAYAAALISFLTITVFKIPFSNLEGFSRNLNYKLIVLNKSSIYAFFNETGDPLIRSIFKKQMDETMLPDSYPTGLQTVCNSSKLYAFYAPNYPLEQIRSANNFCPMASIRVNLLEGLSIIAQKGSPYLNIFNYNINRLRDFGIFKRLLQAEFHQKVVLDKQDFASVEITSVVPIFFILLAGFGLALLLLWSEVLISKVKGNAESSKKHIKKTTNNKNNKNVRIH